MIHKAFPVDEEVWLTRDGVAKGEDDVVKRALEWINTLSYVHDVQLAQTSRDTLLITARVQNPLGHTLTVTAFLEADRTREPLSLPSRTTVSMVMVLQAIVCGDVSLSLLVTPSYTPQCVPMT